MMTKPPPEFWTWANRAVFPPRLPQGDPKNIRRADLAGILTKVWYWSQREVKRHEQTDQSS